MAKGSDYAYIAGQPVLIGSAGEHDYVLNSGEQVLDTGASSFVYESGTGLGGQVAEVTISDSNGESTGDITIIGRNQSIEDYYGYADSGNSAAAEGDINEYLELRYTVFFVYENTSTEEYSFGFVFDEWRPNNQDCGGDITTSITGLPSTASYVVRDDDPGNDTYSLNPPDGEIQHLWSGENTDGVAIGKFTASELQGSTAIFNTTQYQTNNSYVPQTVRFAGDGGTTVERSYDGTYTTIEIKFGDTFGSG